MLVLNDFSCTYPSSPSQALSHISFKATPGEVVVVAGQSGSGKSTLLHAISGLVPCYFPAEHSGDVAVDGKDCLQAGVGGLAGMVGFLSQNPETQFFAMTVEEDILLSLRCRGVEADEAQRRLREALHVTGLAHLDKSDVSTLSDGQKQRAVMAGLLALRPKLLVLDEPSANLDPAATVDLAGQLAKLKRAGVTIVIAEHRLDWLSDLADRAIVLQQGRQVWQGAFQSLDDITIGRFRLRPRRTTLLKAPDVRNSSFPDTEASLTVENITFGYSRDRLLIDKLSCSFPKGKVTAIVGPSGCGKTSLARILMGLEKPMSGKVLRNGKEWHGSVMPDSAMALQNVDHQLYMPTVEGELSLSFETRDSTSDADTLDFAARFGLGKLLERHPHSLSGGEKQRLAVAATVALNRGLVILDEPTSGLDGGNLDVMVANIRHMASSGITVVLISHDCELLVRTADYSLFLGNNE